MRPNEAGAVLVELYGEPFSRIPFLVFLAIVFCGPIYFAPAYWFLGVGGFLLFATLYVWGEISTAAMLRIDAICEHGIVITERGVDTLIPWSYVQTLTTAVYHKGTRYKVNTREASYRLGQGLRKEKLRAVVDAIVANAPLTWVHQTVAVRPENVAEANKTMDKILAQLGR